MSKNISFQSEFQVELSKLQIRQGKQEKRSGKEAKVAYSYNFDGIYRSINSTLNVLSANHLFGNTAENRSLEL